MVVAAWPRPPVRDIARGVKEVHVQPPGCVNVTQLNCVFIRAHLRYRVRVRARYLRLRNMLTGPGVGQAPPRLGLRLVWRQRRRYDKDHVMPHADFNERVLHTFLH